jgi:hypothetical protein
MPGQSKPAPPPPFDRSIALACSVSSLTDHILEAYCGHDGCRRPSNPVSIRLLARQRMTLADAIVRLRCKGCRQPPKRVVLMETYAQNLGAYGGTPPWRITLVGEDRDD